MAEKQDSASTASLDNVSEYQGFDDAALKRIQKLARSFSRTSTVNALDSLTSAGTLGLKEPVVPFGAQNLDPRLDPNLDEFSARLWVLNLSRLVEQDPDYYKTALLGVSFKNLLARGYSVDADYQSTFYNTIPKALALLTRKVLNKKPSEFDILKPMDGLLKPGQLCVVLGKPGAGCTTFLKTIATQTYGFRVAPESEISYDGILPKDIHNHFRGDVVYCAETEHHFPNLTVGDTLKFAANMRAPANRPPGVLRDEYAEHMTDVIMATYGLSHTKNSRVGNDFIRGVSGGERKRVSICEVSLSGAQIQCWDNLTRGLDSATALEFIKALKTSAAILNKTPMVAIYQCSQAAYDIFDTVQLLYEGYQIFFGDSKRAKEYFLEMGYECPQRQTTADFLTSITSPSERKAKKGFENKVPKTPEEFYKYWLASEDHKKLLSEIDEYNSNITSESAENFKTLHYARQLKRARPGLPYVVSYAQQVKYIMGRNWLRIKGDPSITLFMVFAQLIMAFIISLVFYNLRLDTGSFYYRTAAIFFSLLFNAFGSLLEVFSLFEARQIVEKHKTYALYHPSADALASVVTELPTKIIIAIVFNLVFYFMVNLKREPGPFFFYLLINFLSTLAMSHIFRTIGASAKTLSEAMTPSSLLLSVLVIFTGFVIPLPNMHRWCFWLYYLNPIAYGFEALIVNEFHGRDFSCAQYIPSGPGYPSLGNSVICSPVSSVAGRPFVNGDAYVEELYHYHWENRWRNFGIILAFVIFFLATYVGICEVQMGAMQKGEILLFQKRYLDKLNKLKKHDVESGEALKISDDLVNEKESTVSEKGPSTGHRKVFQWKNLTYQVKIKKENRVILNDVSGYVKPGTVTALMGASGAGKTTLLNALSDRLTSGVITDGTRMVNGRPLDASFQRSTGYVQQQDLHLQTLTVYEALVFSAKLRQPALVPLKEKLDYVEYVIDLLEMRPYANAVVGVAGEGLNVEQRKRLTIGVELAAKPDFLVFLDEPTSGLDSQTAWLICQLIRKLANHGHAILCTIHQPLAILMQEFDRLLFLQKGGKTVYFGDLGPGCTQMIEYFEKYGAPKCPTEANPAEWMLEVIGAAPGSHANQDYHEVWKSSTEYTELLNELDTMEKELAAIPEDKDPEQFLTYAAPLWQQYLAVTERVFQQTWRTPSYTYLKLILAVANALFNGFVFFKAKKSLMGMQSQMFSVFMFLMPYNPIVQQYLPNFVFQRDLYEARERPLKTFSWVAFIAAQITSEIPWQIFTGTLSFFCWYYPAGFQNNAAEAGDTAKRGALMWIAVVLFYVWMSTMAQLCISFNELADNAANLSLMLFTLCLMFCGVLAGPKALPGFWIFMYRCNPTTYLIAALLLIGVSDSKISCATKELLKFSPPEGLTCQGYMAPYIKAAGGGYLTEASKLSTTACEYCLMSDTNQFLNQVSIDPTKVPRNLGVFLVFIFFNIFAIFFFYWLARVPKGAGKRSA